MNCTSLRNTWFEKSEKTALILKIAACLILAAAILFASSFLASAADDQNELWESTSSGALYKDGIFTYGPVSIDLGPGWVVEDSDVEGIQSLLISYDLQTIVYVRKLIDNNTTYEATTEEEMLSSYETNSDYADSSILSFEKTHLGSYPVVNYHAKTTLTADALDEHIFECIVMNDSEPNWTLRIIAECLSEDSVDAISKAFDNASLAEEPVHLSIMNGVTYITAE